MKYLLNTETDEIQFDNLEAAIAACEEEYKNGRKFRLWDYSDFLPGIVTDYIEYKNQKEHEEASVYCSPLER